MAAATWNDVDARLSGGVQEEQRARVDILLNDLESDIRARIPDLSLVPTETLVKIEARAVAKFLELEQESKSAASIQKDRSLDDYRGMDITTYRQVSRKDRDLQPYLTDADWDELQAVKRQAFSIRIGPWSTSNS